MLCQSGWHLATHQGIGKHAQAGAVLWIAEGRGACDSAPDKVAFSSARLVSQVGTLTRVIAVQWAAECARRVLKHYEDRYPEDKRPREAIQAALKWAKDPTEANRAAAAAAATPPPTPPTPPPPPLPAASAAAYAAAAANAASNAAANAAAAAYAAAYAAAHAAAYAAAHAAGTAYAKEREWQSNRLLELLRAS